MVEVAKVCPGLPPDQKWTVVAAFQCYAGAVIDFNVLQFMRVQRGEGFPDNDWDALGRGSFENDEVEC